MTLKICMGVPGTHTQGLMFFDFRFSPFFALFIPVYLPALFEFKITVLNSVLFEFKLKVLNSENA